MNAYPKLQDAVRVSNELREQLKAEYGLCDDDETLADTLEGITDIHTILGRVAREALATEAMSEGLGVLIAENRSRMARLDAKAEKLRALVLWAMQEAGIKKSEQPDFSLTIPASSRKTLGIYENIPIPDEFTRIKRDPDKPKIKAALEAGEHLDFAYLSNSKPSLTIRKG